MIFGKLAKKNREKTPETYESYRSHLIEELIGERYSLRQEIAIIRQKDAKPEEYKAYFEYVEQCKDTVNSLLK